MIGKLIRGRSMRGLLDYLLSPIDQKKATRPRAAIIGGTFAGTTAREIAREFVALRALRPNLNVAVVHETLRLPAGAAEPSDERWHAIARHWAEAMGFQAWFAVAHGDGHIHVGASRILVDGSVVSDKHDWTLSERVVRDIERRFGLEEIKPSHLLDHDRDWIQQKTPTKAQSAVADKTGLPLPAEIVAAVIDGLLAEPVSITDFVRGLEAAGIDVRPNIASTGRVSGLAYALGGVTVTAHAMGRAYTWSHLQRRGLAFDAIGDLPALRAAHARSLAQEKARLTAEHDDDVQPMEGSPAQRAAQAFASVAIAKFVDAAGTDEFMVFHEPRTPSAAEFTDINALMQPAMLNRMLDGGRFNAAIRADLLDPRIVVITELGQSQLGALDQHGLQPFAVSEIGPGVFEACIRLLPATAPEPSLKVVKEAAAIVTRIVGGQVSDVISLPGFIKPTPRVGSKRRLVVMLRKAVKVVAARGAELLASARRRLEDIGSKPKEIQPNEELPLAVSQLIGRGDIASDLDAFNSISPPHSLLGGAICGDDESVNEWNP